MKQKPSDIPKILKWSLRLALFRAGWVVFFERMRTGLWMPVSLLLLFIAVSLSGLFELLPTALHVALLAGFLAAFLASLFFAEGGLSRFRFPGANARARRLEEENALAHRPLREAEDVPVVNADNGLWQAHREWQTSQLNRALRAGALRIGAVRAGLASRDAYALRVGALVLALAALGVTAQPLERLWNALSPFALDGTASASSIEIWVTPPAYTGRAPLYPAMSAGKTVTMEVPEGSELVIRIEGDEDASLHVLREEDEDLPATGKTLADGKALADGKVTATGKAAATGEEVANEEAAAEEETLTAFETLSTGSLEHRSILDAESEVELLAAGMEEPARWNFTILHDQPPSITLVSPIAYTQLGSLRIEYITQDDYAVASAHARVELDPRLPSNQEISRLEGKPPSVPPARILLPLSPSFGEESARAYHDLTAHPWAGLPVRLTLVAKDEAGQTGYSQAVYLTLPEIGFESLLARAFMELRRNLILRPGEIEWVAQMLDAFAIGPEKYELSATDYLHLRTAYWKLRLGGTEPESVEEVRALLWHMALRAESGELPDLEEQMKQAREALEKAIAEKAPEGEIRELLEKFRQALEQYLSQQARDNIEKGNATREEALETINADQLSKMLQQIAEFSSVGAYEEAQDILSNLEEILENLQFGSSSQAMTPEDQAIGEALGELRGLERQQQRLLDQTFQEQLRACPIGEVCGDNTELPADTARELQELQEQLRSQLNEILENLTQGGVAPPESLQQGQESMGEAAEGLGRGASGEGLRAQADALERLQEARDELRRRGSGGMASGRDGPGKRGRAGNNHDPLGRNMPDNPGRTDDDIVPEDFDPQRARELRGELLRRMGESWRPSEELKYFERLLRSSAPAITP